MLFVRFILARSFPDTAALVADNNVRYMALQALAVLTQIDIQVIIIFKNLAPPPYSSIIIVF